MTMSSPEFHAFVARLERMERENRWLKRGVFLFVVLAGAGLLMAGQESPKGKTMQGERFSLKDPRGKERAYLGMGTAGPVLRFLDESGDERAGLEMGREGIFMRLLDAKGNLQTGLSLEPMGVAIVSYNDDSGKPLVGTNALKNESGALTPRRRR